MVVLLESERSHTASLFVSILRFFSFLIRNLELKQENEQKQKGRLIGCVLIALLYVVEIELQFWIGCAMQIQLPPPFNYWVGLGWAYYILALPYTFYLVFNKRAAKCEFTRHCFLLPGHDFQRFILFLGDKTLQFNILLQRINSLSGTKKKKEYKFSSKCLEWIIIMQIKTLDCKRVWKIIVVDYGM